MTPPSLPPSPVNSGDKALIILCHLSIFLSLAFLLPLIVLLVKGGESPLVAAHAKETLNFHISLVIYSIACIPLLFFLIGFPLLLGVILMGMICAILAAIKASEGGFYFYPLTIRLIT